MLYVLHKMKTAHIAFSAILTCTSCGSIDQGVKEQYVSSPAAIDSFLDRATVEDYIVALPPYSFHEAPSEWAIHHARTARYSHLKNTGRSKDSLYLSGDGCWPAQEFFLDRKTKTLVIRVYTYEPGEDPYEYKMRRVTGGWMRGPHRRISARVQERSATN